MIILRHELAPSDVRFSTLYARAFGAKEALRRGVFDELQPKGDVLPRALEIARDMATMPADSYKKVKTQVRRAALDEIEAVLATENDPMHGDWVSAEAKAASSGYLKEGRGA